MKYICSSMGGIYTAMDAGYLTRLGPDWFMFQTGTDTPKYFKQHSEAVGGYGGSSFFNDQLHI